MKSFLNGYWLLVDGLFVRTCNNMTRRRMTVANNKDLTIIFNKPGTHIIMIFAEINVVPLLHVYNILMYLNRMR